MSAQPPGAFGPPASPFLGAPNFLQRMADGTLKQINPFTGTEVWTVPGRARRPLKVDAAPARPLTDQDRTGACAFCPDRCLETPPEKARLVDGPQGERVIRHVRADQLFDTVAQFRRVPNLFEIVSFDYWQLNYGHRLSAGQREHMLDYLSTDAGRRHVEALAERRANEPWAHMSEADRRSHAEDFFGGGHDVIIARRHFVDGAADDGRLASSGTLTPDEHDSYLRFTIDAQRDLYAGNRYVRYVAVFQNWLRPAGASFDHLHKQLVAIDERGVQAELEIQRARANPNGYNEFAVDYAARHNLTVAENDHAVAFAGFGHRYPTLEIFSRSERPQPWLHSAAELRGMSDLIHALHAATGPLVPCNEEWHHKPPDADVPMPWRVLIKWRLSTIAGFEGGTKIYLNTIDPQTLRDIVTQELTRLRDKGSIADTLRIGPECACVPNSLRYNPAVGRTVRPDAAFPSLYGASSQDPPPG